MATPEKDDLDEGETRITTRPAETVVGGRYVLERKLAAGAFGVVYAGHYSILDQHRRVAVKLLKAAGKADPAAVVRFREEVRTLSLLNHPNICKVIDGGIDDGMLFLVMEFAEGGSLKAKMKESPDGRVAPAVAIRWLREAAQGLLAAETNRREDGTPAPVYHRDVKPDNLLLQDGRVVVADFGAAKLGGDNLGVTSEIVPALWTPLYGSPEQTLGIADQRSDVYALGATFFHMLTGKSTQARFGNPDHRYSEPHDPHAVCREVPRELGAIIRKMTEPDPARRHQSFAEVLADLKAIEEPPRSSPIAARMLALVAVALLATAGLQVAGVIDLFGPTIVQDPTARPLREVCERSQRVAADLAKVLTTEDWQSLAGLRIEFENLSEKAATNLATADELKQRFVASGGDIEQGLRMPSNFTLAEVESEKGRLEKLLETQRRLRNELLELQRRVDGGLSTGAARDSLAARRPQLAASPELLEAAARLDARIDALEAERRAQVEVLEAKLRDGVFERLPEDAAALATAMDASGEGVLAGRARSVAEGTARARELKASSPVWPRGDVEPARAAVDFEGLRQALARCAEIRESLPPGLLPWWKDHAEKLVAGWSTILAGSLRADLAAFNASAEAFNMRADAGTAKAAERKPLADARAALDARFLEVRDLCRQRPQLMTAPLQELLYQTPTELGQLGMVDAEALKPFNDAVADPKHNPNSDAVAAELKAPALAVQQACAALRKDLEGLDRRTAGSRDVVRLERLRQGLEAARRGYDDAESVLLEYQKAEGEFAKRSCASLRDLCRERESLRSFAVLDARRKALLARVDALATERRAGVEGLVQRLRSGTPELEALVASAGGVATTLEQASEQELVRRVRDLEADIQAARKLQADLPQWEPPAEASLDGAVKYVAAMEELARQGTTTERNDLAEWGAQRRLALATLWSEPAVKLLRVVHSDLERRIQANPAPDPAAAAALALECGTYDAAMKRLRAIVEAPICAVVRREKVVDMVLPTNAGGTRTAPLEIPKDWPSREFAPPPGIKAKLLSDDDADCLRLYPKDFLVRAKASQLRLWFFPDRKDKDGRHVFMAFCEDGDGPSKRAALVDVHPVVFGELRATAHGDFRASSYYPARLKEKSNQTFYYDSSIPAGRSFVQSVAKQLGAAGPRLDFVPAGLRQWSSVQFADPAPRIEPREDARPVLSSPMTDVATNGLGYLRSGVKEWASRGSEVPIAEGVSEIEAPAGENSRRLDTGLRLAIALAKW